MNYKWSDIESFLSHGIEIRYALQEELQYLMEKWDDKLEKYGGDTCKVDLHRFRIIKSDRENDWSDWLQFLFEQSNFGILACHCFENVGKDVLDFKMPRVERERRFTACEEDEKNRQTDILIHANNSSNIFHIEVKIDDDKYEKIYETSKLLREKHRNVIADFILLPPYNVGKFKEVKKRMEGGKNKKFDITIITWEKVALAIRKSLGENKENIIWNSIAYLLLSAIEQKILGQRHVKYDSSINHLPINVLAEMIKTRRIFHDCN